MNDALFSSDLWEPALKKYASATHVTIKLFDADERVIFGTIHPTPFFQLFDGQGYDPGIFDACARQCLAQTGNRPAVVVSQTHGLAVIGTSLVLDGKIVGAAVAGYVLVDFSQVSEIQRIAQKSGIAFDRVWRVARQEKPVPRERLILNGELLQVLGDALLRENYRTRQYEENTAHYRALFDLEPVAVFYCDRSGVIQDYNPRAAELWGRNPTRGDANERFCGSFKLLHPDGTPLPHAESPIAGVLRTGIAVRDVEVLIERPDGTRISVIVYFSPLDDGHGEVTGAITCFLDISERKAAEEALRQSHASLERTVELRTASLRELSSRLLSLQDGERRRIARELHDGLAQDLVFAKLTLASLKRPDATEKEEEGHADLMDALDKCLTETRTISYMLHPPGLEELGFSSTAKWYVEGFSKRSGIQVDLKLPAESKRLPRILELALFRILQEGLTNIHRHAHSQSAEIEVDLSADEVALQVRDYGQGVPPELLAQFRANGTGAGVGLRSMRERVSELGGRFEIESGKDGTLIRVTAPLPVAAEPER
ncbi:MAG: ATP-binding protein [Terriglobia bacterium]